MPDFIPGPDLNFNDFITTLNGSVNDAANPLGLTPTQITAFNTDVATWSPAWSAYVAAAPTFHGLVTAKDTARAAMEAAARAVNKLVQANSAVPDSAKTAAQLPIHKTTHTPVGPIATAPMIYKMDNEHLLHRIWFSDASTPGKRAKPPGAHFCELREQIVDAGGAAPTDPNAMPFLANETKTPNRNDFDPADAGKTVYYALRWINTKGDPGPWSTISSYPIL